MKKYNTSTLSQEAANELLLYIPENGKLIWKERELKWFKKDQERKRWNTRYAWSDAGNHTDKGYIALRVFRQTYFSHRLIWFMTTGEWPHEIDHINHVRDDNRLINLRDIHPDENQRNASRRKDNVSGTTGVGWNKNLSKWTAYISINKRLVHLGCFSEKEDAVSARASANIEHGFHANHGGIAKSVA